MPMPKVMAKTTSIRQGAPLPAVGDGTDSAPKIRLVIRTHSRQITSEAKKEMIFG